MKNFNEVSIIKVSAFTGESARQDKHGLDPVILTVIAGKCPNKSILSGTFAERELFEVGNTYLVMCQEIETSEEYGRQFRFTNLGKVPFSEMVSTMKQLGKATIVDVLSAEDEEVTPPINEPSTRQPSGF
jgi:hypothetical protein